MTPPDRPAGDPPAALRRATLALALIAAGTYAMAELVARDGSPVPLAMLVACALAPRLARHRPLATGPAAVLAFGAIGLALVDWWLVTGDAVMALGRAVLGLQFVRLWAPLGGRERLQVYLLSLAHLAAASVLTTDILFALFLAGYAVIGTWSLVLNFLANEAAACGAPPPRTTARFLGGISAVAIAAILLTAAIFLLVPRVGAGLLQANLTRRRVKVAGFGDSVQIGDLGEILKGTETVMQVSFPDGGDGDETRFRGRVFERCRKGDDNRYHWTAPTQEGGHRLSFPLQVVQTNVEGVHAAERGKLTELMRTHQPTTVNAERVRHIITLSPLSSAALFTAGPPVEMRFRRPGPVPDRIDLDPDGCVVEWPNLGRVATEQVTYEVTGWTVIGQGVYAPVPAPKRQVTLQECTAMPEGMAPELVARLRATAESWVFGATDPNEVAGHIEEQLRDRQGFAYTLQQPDPGDRDPIEYFLYEAKAGHCDYYAASMVLLVRSLGHPARLVTGFLGGEVNPFDGHREVRQSDAHAWVEVLGPSGWDTYDPTPRADDPAGAMAIFRQMMDYVRYRWYSGVIDYDVRDQQRALEHGMDRVRRWGHRLRRAPQSLARAARGWRGPLGLACVAIGLYLLVVRRRGPRAGGLRRPGLAFYADLLRRLERRGLVRAPGQTPRELARAAAALPGVPPEPVRELTDLFCAARYRGDVLDAAAQERARAALARLQDAERPAPDARRSASSR